MEKKKKHKNVELERCRNQQVMSELWKLAEKIITNNYFATICKFEKRFATINTMLFNNIIKKIDFLGEMNMEKLLNNFNSKI